MATYTNMQEVNDARKNHPKFLVFKAGDVIQGNLIPQISKFQGNSEESSISIIYSGENLPEAINVFQNNELCGPFVLSEEFRNISSNTIECLSGEFLVFFKF